MHACMHTLYDRKNVKKNADEWKNKGKWDGMSVRCLLNSSSYRAFQLCVCHIVSYFHAELRWGLTFEMWDDTFIFTAHRQWEKK